MDIKRTRGRFSVYAAVLLAAGCSDRPTDPDLLAAPRLEVSSNRFTITDE